MFRYDYAGRLCELFITYKLQISYRGQFARGSTWYSTSHDPDKVKS